MVYNMSQLCVLTELRVSEVVVVTKRTMSGFAIYSSRFTATAHKPRRTCT